MDERDMLLIPGPVTVSDEVLAVHGRPIRPHYGTDWVEVYRAVTGALAQVFRTRGTVFLLFGPGMAGIEAALRSTLAPGDQVLIPASGSFAGRMAEVARAAGLEVRSLETSPRRPADVAAVEEALDTHPEIRALGIVHHETMLGLVNPVAELCRAASERGVLTIVDAVSSLGGIDLRVDEWGIDVCVGVANKCLGGPIGVAPIAVSERAWAAVDDGRPKGAGWYLDLATWRRFDEEWGSWHPHPTTMPTSVIEALGAAAERILAEGLDAYQAHHAEAAHRVRRGLEELGFELLVPDDVASPVTTAALPKPGMDVDHYTDWLRREYRLRIAPGIGDLAGKIFRVGHMGRASEPDVVTAYLAATAAYLKEAHLS